MFRFANPEYLYLLLLIPLLIGLFVYSTYRQRKRLEMFGDLELLKDLMPNVSWIRPQIKFYITLLALLLIIFVLARPQFGSKISSVKRQGIEAIIALDVSNSMMAQDVQPNRLEYAKMMLSKLIDGMTEDKVGLIVFAGDAFVQIPITSDYVSAKMFLSSITPKLVPRQGTAIGGAIDLAMRSFGEENKDKSRTIIVFTDGENHEDNAVGAAAEALERGISVNVVGMGRPEGVPLLIENTMSFRKDKEGNVVVSKLNETMCQQIAEAGNGMYVRADNSNTALRALQKELAKMSKSEIETKVYSEYDEKFYIFAWIALFLLLLEFYILNRKNKELNRLNFFDKDIFKKKRK
ncbi:MAG: VWA domain-containing protein [Paludibacteraceae bacterium]|nr:VWA domain-containing protein [Paludibacteraceae bacterium]